MTYRASGGSGLSIPQLSDAGTLQASDLNATYRSSTWYKNANTAAATLFRATPVASRSASLPATISAADNNGLVVLTGSAGNLSLSGSLPDGFRCTVINNASGDATYSSITGLNSTAVLVSGYSTTIYSNGSTAYAGSYSLNLAYATTFSVNASPTHALPGNTVTVTLTPSGGMWNVGTTITPTASGITFSPTPPISVSGGTTTPRTFTFTTPSSGPVVISFANNMSSDSTNPLSNPSDFSYTVDTPVAPGNITSFAAGTPTQNTIPVTYTAPSTGTGTITYTGKTSLDDSTYTSNGGTFTATGGTFTGLTASTAYYLEIVASNGVNPDSVTKLGGGSPTTVTTSGAVNAGTIMTAPFVWWDASSNKVFKDVAKTQQATADGDNVAVLANVLANNSRDIFNSDAGSLPVFKPTGMNSHPTVQGVSAHTAALATDTDTWINGFGAGDFTLYYVGSGRAQISNFSTGSTFIEYFISDGEYPSFGYADQNSMPYDDITPNSLVVAVCRVRQSDKLMTMKINTRTEIQGHFTTATPAVISRLVQWFYNTDSNFMECAISTAYEADSVRDALITAGLAKWS